MTMWLVLLCIWWMVASMAGLYCEYTRSYIIEKAGLTHLDQPEDGITLDKLLFFLVGACGLGTSLLAHKPKKVIVSGIRKSMEGKMLLAREQQRLDQAIKEFEAL